MFEPDLYRKVCSEKLTLPEEKIQEMIVLTENKKHGLRKPLQMSLAAAALAVVMCVTAAAANPEGVKELWHNITMSVTVLRDDGDMVFVQTEAPEITVEDVDGRIILIINDESADITDALEQEGKYVADWSDESATGRITVYPDKRWEMDVTLADGSQVHTNSDSGWIAFETLPYAEEDGTKFYQFTDGDNIGEIGSVIYPTPEE